MFQAMLPFIKAVGPSILGGLASGMTSRRGSPAPAGSPDRENSAGGGDTSSGFAQFAGLGDGFGEALGNAMSEKVSNAFLGLGRGQDFGSGKFRGAQLREFMDEAYPGTNPWERLGGTGGGAASASGATNKLEMEKLKTQERIADKQVKSQQAVAQTQAGATRYAADAQSGASRYGSELSSSATRYASERPFRETVAMLNAATQRSLWRSAEAQNWSSAHYNFANAFLANALEDLHRQGIIESKARTGLHRQGVAESRSRVRTQATERDLNRARAVEADTAAHRNQAQAAESNARIPLHQADTAYKRVLADIYPKLAGSEIDRNKTSSVLGTMFNVLKEEGGNDYAWQTYGSWLDTLGWIIAIGGPATAVARGATAFVGGRGAWMKAGTDRVRARSDATRAAGDALKWRSERARREVQNLLDREKAKTEQFKRFDRAKRQGRED